MAENRFSIFLNEVRVPGLPEIFLGLLIFTEISYLLSHIRQNMSAVGKDWANVSFVIYSVVAWKLESCTCSIETLEKCVEYVESWL